MGKVIRPWMLRVAAVVAVGLVVGCATTQEAAVQETMVVPSDALEAEETAPEVAVEMAEAADAAADAAAPAEAAAAAEASPDTPGVDGPVLSSTYDFPEYRIGAGDLLSFRSYDDPSLDSEVVVRHDGYIALPWIPDVLVLGKTREEATALLREAYSELYFDPEVSLQVVEARSRFFTVMGDVQRPNQYPYTRPMSVLDGINQAGGIRITQQGGDSFVGTQGQLMKAILIRDVSGDRTATELDLRDIQHSGPHPGNTPMLPGDLVYVPEGINLIYLLGEGVRSRALALREGMTLLQLLSNAGGFNESVTRMREVVVMREVSSGETQLLLCDLKQMLSTGEQFVVQAGDIIYLPRKRLVNLAEFIARVSSPITQTTSVASQVMSLYTQAYDTYYTDERFDRLFRDQGAGVNTLDILQSIRDLNDFAGELAPVLATE